MPLADPWAPEPPALLVSPSWEFTRGPEVADLCALLGYDPMPEQEQWLDAVFAVGSDGLPAVTDATDLAGRQNLKTGEFAMTALGWMFITEEDRVLWSAHEFGTARDSYLLIRSLLERKPWAMGRVRQFYGSSNYTAVVLRATASRPERVLEFTARTTSQGRGKSAPKAIWDEGLELRAEHLGAQDAVKSTFPWAQTLIGTSGLKPYSEVVHGIVDKAWKGQLGPKDFFREFRDDLPGECLRGRECTHVYGIQGCRLDEKERWKRNNPALERLHADGRGLTVAAVERERAKQPDPLIFARERLGWHQELDLALAQVFSAEAWKALGPRKGEPLSKIAGDPVFALHVSPNRDWSAILAGGFNAAGRMHLEVTSRKVGDQPRQYNRRPSTDWVVGWFKDRVGAGRRYRRLTLVIQDGSSAASLAPALKKIKGLKLVRMPDASLPAACGFLLDQVSAGNITHVGDPELAASMQAVSKRMVGDKAFVWSPRSSAGDITAAMGATWLAWYLENGGTPYDLEESVG